MDKARGVLFLRNGVMNGGDPKGWNGSPNNRTEESSEHCAADNSLHCFLEEGKSGGMKSKLTSLLSRCLLTPSLIPILPPFLP